MKTRISFHFNVQRPIDYAARLLRKVYSAHLGKPHKALVVVPQADAASLSELLWTQDAEGFLAHALVLTLPQAHTADSTVTHMPHLAQSSLSDNTLAQSPVVLVADAAELGLWRSAPNAATAMHTETVNAQVFKAFGQTFSLLVNVGAALPAEFMATVPQFERVVELVGADEGLKQAARDRWRLYTQLGAVIEKFDAKN